MPTSSSTTITTTAIEKYIPANRIALSAKLRNYDLHEFRG